MADGNRGHLEVVWLSALYVACCEIPLARTCKVGIEPKMRELLQSSIDHVEVLTITD